MCSSCASASDATDDDAAASVSVAKVHSGQPASFPLALSLPPTPADDTASPFFSSSSSFSSSSASSSPPDHLEHKHSEHPGVVVVASLRPLSPTTARPESNVLRARNSHWVFVYGTLKRGFANHSLLVSSTYLGEFRTQTPYPLVVGGAFFSPYLLDIPGAGSPVLGEVYAVCNDTLASLDILENVGVNYSRTAVTVTATHDRSFNASAYVYLKCNFDHDLLQKPMMESYQCRKYVPRHRRPRQALQRAEHPHAGCNACAASVAGVFGKSAGASECALHSSRDNDHTTLHSILGCAAVRSKNSAVDTAAVAVPALADHPGVSLYAGSANACHTSHFTK